MRRRGAIGLLSATLLVATMSAPSTGAARSAPPGSGGRLVAHHSGARKIATPSIVRNAPRAELLPVGVGAFEPTIGVTGRGAVFFQAAGYGDGFLAVPSVMRSTDLGRTWADVSPAAAGTRTHAHTGDPYLHVDPVTSRVFTADLLANCAALSRSDDDGATWQSSVVTCQHSDHQTVFTGPPVLSTVVGYPRVVYYCSIIGGIGYMSAANACSKSLDGGATFLPTGGLPYPDPRTIGYCYAGTGHGATGDDGTVYLPRAYCNQAVLAISRDEGATWTNVTVSSMRTTGFHETAVVADGPNVYYLFIAEDDLDVRLPHLVVSRDGGRTWGEPMMVAPPGLEETNLPGLAIGGRGKVAMVYMGRRVDDRPDSGPPTWDGYVTVSANVLAKNPVLYSGPVNDPRDPLVRGKCGPGVCGPQYDFVDVAIAPNGTTWASFSDGCTPARCPLNTLVQDGVGVVGRLVGGPSLR